MSAIDDFLREIECYDIKWFKELGGDEARSEVESLRKVWRQYNAEIPHHLPECGTLYRGCSQDCPKRIFELETAAQHGVQPNADSGQSVNNRAGEH